MTHAYQWRRCDVPLAQVNILDIFWSFMHRIVISTWYVCQRFNCGCWAVLFASVQCCHHNKHNTFVYHLYNVGPTSSTLVQHCIKSYKCFVFTGHVHQALYCVGPCCSEDWPASWTGNRIGAAVDIGHLSDLGLMWGHRRRRWPDIEFSLACCVWRLIYTCWGRTHINLHDYRTLYLVITEQTRHVEPIRCCSNVGPAS